MRQMAVLVAVLCGSATILGQRSGAQPDEPTALINANVVNVRNHASSRHASQP